MHEELSQEDLFFSYLEGEMDWNSPIQEAAETLVDELEEGETGGEKVQHILNVLAVADQESNFSFVNMEQLIAHIGAACCDPQVEETLNNISGGTSAASTAVGAQAGHDDCPDEHGPATKSTTSAHMRKSKSKSNKKKYVTKYKPVPIPRPFWELAA